MSEMTIVQMLFALAGKRAVRPRGVGAEQFTWIDLPFACVLFVCILLLVFAAVIVKAIAGFFRQSDNRLPYDTRGHE